MAEVVPKAAASKPAAKVPAKASTAAGGSKAMPTSTKKLEAASTVVDVASSSQLVKKSKAGSKASSAAEPTFNGEVSPSIKISAQLFVMRRRVRGFCRAMKETPCSSDADPGVRYHHTTPPAGTISGGQLWGEPERRKQ